jgi:hypothetical protein
MRAVKLVPPSKQEPEMRIEKDIPIPPRAGKNLKYEFYKMEVGDSFAVPTTERMRLISAAHGHKMRHPEFNYTVRTSETEVRVSRVAVEGAKA